MYQFKLPDLGEGIAEVEVVEWLVREGDVVQEDQPLAEVETDKALVEISSPRAGRIHRLCARAGEVLRVGQVLLEIDDSAGPGVALAEAQPGADARAAKTAPDESSQRRGAASEAQAAAPAAVGPAGRPAPSTPPEPLAAVVEPTVGHRPPRMPPRPEGRAAPIPAEHRKPADTVPAVRELARQRGVELEQVCGTGPGGRVMRRDVEAFHAERERGGPAPAAAPGASPEQAQPDEPDWTRRPLRGVRRLIAERMTRSKATIPHYTLVEEVDVTVMEERREALAESAEADKLSPLPFIAHAALRVLTRYPQMNACLDERTGELILKGKIHLGIAVATEDGLMVPVIRDAAGRGVAELAARIRDLSGRARARQLDPSELRGATFTITSLGKLGGLMATPIINYPASAILGVHAIRTLPRYVDGQLAPRRILNLSVSLDHRIVDGSEGARFVQELREILERAGFPELG